jgi:hypothetical protein
VWLFYGFTCCKFWGVFFHLFKKSKMLGRDNQKSSRRKRMASNVCMYVCIEFVSRTFAKKIKWRQSVLRFTLFTEWRER